MNKKDLILNILLFISQIIVFYYFFCYLFPFKEQLQMFQFTSQYLTETLKQAGGVAIYISEFLSQFYVVFWTGPIISALLLTLVALLSSLILKKINSRNDLPLIFLLPWLSLLIISLDYDYYEQGTIAYLFLLLFLWLYTNIKTRIKFIYGICIIPILYGIAGPIVHLFAISALFFEFLTNGKKKYISIIYLLIAALSAIAGTYLGYSRNLTLAFLPEAYCNPLQTVSGIYYAWYALPMTMLLVAYLKRYKEPVSLKGKCIWEGAQWAIMFLLVYQGIFHFGKLDAQHSMKQDYLLRTEQWDLVISEFNHDV